MNGLFFMALALTCVSCGATKAVLWEGINTTTQSGLYLYDDFSYSVAVDSVSWLTSCPYSLFDNGSWRQFRTPVNHTGFTGSDTTFGSFTGYRLNFSYGWTVEFIYYTQIGTLRFIQSFSSELQGVNTSWSTNSTSGPCIGAVRNESVSEFCSSAQPSTTFPCFEAAASAPTQAGYLTWGGRFSVGFTGEGISNGIQNVLGSEGGPLVLYEIDVTSTKSTGASLVLSPLEELKTTILGHGPNMNTTCLAVGVSGSITQIPAGYSLSSIMTINSKQTPIGGITGAVLTWGKHLQQWYQTSRMEDNVYSKYLSYWTDNGAYYDWYAYKNITSKGIPEDVMVELKQSLDNSLGIPIHSWQIDAYWYSFDQVNGNCKLGDNVWNVPFPSGLKSLSDRLGAPLIMYNGPTCSGAVNISSQWPVVYSVFWNQGWGQGILMNVDPNSSFNYYDQLLAQLGNQGSGAFEMDFLDFQYLLFPAFNTQLGNFEKWLGGLAAACEHRNQPLQLCMELPSDLLVSLKYKAITNARASQDYSAGGDNWRIGITSLLIAAVGLRPSKDNFWTFGKETNPYVVAVVSVLTAGPVGFADELYKTNPLVLWPAVRKDGMILSPTSPATAMDCTMIPHSAHPLASYDVRTSYSCIEGIGCNNYNVLFATPNNQIASLPFLPNVVRRDDLYPLLDQNIVDVVAFRWNDTSCGGAPCLFPLLSSSSKPVASPTNQSTFALWAITIRVQNWTFLGEVDKYVPLSDKRVKSIFVGNASHAMVTLCGSDSAQESISFAYVTSAQPGKVKNRKIILKPGCNSVLFS